MESSTQSGAAPVARRRRKAPLVLATLVILAAVGGGVAWLLGRGHESTDDAQVEGRIVNIGPRIPGQVVQVLVEDNQVVEAGTVLVKLDPAELDARLDAVRADRASAQAALQAARTSLTITEHSAPANLEQAKGTLAQAESTVSSSKAGLAQARAAVASAHSRENLARVELDRFQKLRADGTVPQAELDIRQASFDQATAARELAEAQLASAVAAQAGSSGNVSAAQGRVTAAQTVAEQIEAARSAVAVAEARLAQTEAAVRMAELNRSYAEIKAPLRGVVSRRTVEVGQLVSPERALMALVSPDDMWVVANFKEDQLAEMKPGERAEVSVDTWSGRVFEATVDSLAGASGARFSLLPPDNATGNFVKVVQRIPVKLTFAHPPEVPLRPGMSAEVTVYTR